MWTPWKTEIASAWKIAMTAIRAMEEDLLALKTEFACGPNSQLSALERRVQSLAEDVQRLRTERPIDIYEEFSDLEKAVKRDGEFSDRLSRRVAVIESKLRTKKRKE